MIKKPFTLFLIVLFTTPLLISCVQKEGSSAPATISDVMDAPEKQSPVTENPVREPMQPAKNKYEKQQVVIDFQQLSVGDSVPDLYRSEQYHIKEWQKRHLPAPDTNSHWTYAGSSYVLISNAEGKILKIMSGDILYQ